MLIQSMKTFRNFISKQISINFNKKRWEPMKKLWKKIPEQVRLLSVLLIIIAVVIIVLSSILIPADFGEYGHYRSSAVEEVASQEMEYAGQEVCFDCHDEMVELKKTGYHKDVSCEVCHGPAAKHAEEPGSVELLSPTERGYCPLCHEYLPARPTGFPQIVSASHNPIQPCISCHEPHDPKPPETPKECMACHAKISRVKSISHHVYVPCTRCHETPEEHKTSPHYIQPTKPLTREFCGQCHGLDATEQTATRKVDLATHYERYVCWQCHYPHLPEAE